MMVYMLWHGGSSYAVGTVDDDLEMYDTLQEALAEFERRAWASEACYPCVDAIPPEDGGPTAWLWFDDPRGMSDPYPDQIVSFGPRGGIRKEAILS